MTKTAKTIFKIALSIFCGAAGVGLIYFMYTIVHEWIFIVIPVCIVAVMFPLMMRHGIKTLNKELETVYALLAHNMPMQYNTRRIFRGFTELLLLTWLMPPVPFIVAGDLWVAILPVITVVIIVVEALAYNIWAEIGWSKGKYWLMNIGFYILGIIFGVAISNLIK